MSTKDVIKKYLDNMAKQDFAFAERYKREDKSLDKCIQYIIDKAKKQASKNCAFLENEIVYGWAVHYYMEDNVKVGNTKATIMTSEDKPIKQVKALVKDKKDENKCVELDLFGF